MFPLLSVVALVLTLLAVLATALSLHVRAVRRRFLRGEPRLWTTYDQAVLAHSAEEAAELFRKHFSLRHERVPAEGSSPGDWCLWPSDKRFPCLDSAGDLPHFYPGTWARLGALGVLPPAKPLTACFPCEPPTPQGLTPMTPSKKARSLGTPVTTQPSPYSETPAEETFSLLVYAIVPESVGLYLIPDSLLFQRPDWRAFLELAHGLFVNDDEANAGTDFLSDALAPTALQEDAENFSEGCPPDRRCALAPYRAESAVGSKSIQGVAITHVYKSGFFL